VPANKKQNIASKERISCPGGGGEAVLPSARRYWHLSKLYLSTRVLLLPPAVCSILLVMSETTVQGLRGRKVRAFIGCDCSGSRRDGNGTGTDRRGASTDGVDLRPPEERRWACPSWAIRKRHVAGQHSLEALELGNAFTSSRVLDELRLPINKEVFVRMLSYYEIRSQTERPGSVPTKINAAQLATAAHRRKQ